MPVKKVRMEVYDGDGNRYKISFEGYVTREKVLRLLDLVELLGGMPGINPALNRAPSEFSKFEKVQFIVEKQFPITWFSSKDVQSAFENELKEPISLSTTSTYLSRLTERGILTRKRMSNRRHYRVLRDITQRKHSISI